MPNAMVLLILGLTFGAAYGFKIAKTLVPFLLSFVFFTFCFVWEAQLSDEYAVLPARTWNIPDLAVTPFLLCLSMDGVFAFL